MPELTRDQFMAVRERVLRAAPEGAIVDEASAERYLAAALPTAIAEAEATVGRVQGVRGGTQASAGGTVGGAARPGATEGRVLGAVRFLNQVPSDLSVGLGQAMVKAPVNLAEFASLMPVTGDIARTMNSAFYGVTPEQTAGQRDAVRNEMAAQNTTQLAGQVIGDIAMTMTPGTKITQGATALSARVPKALALPTRLAVEGMGGAALSSAQGQDPAVGAAFGVGVPALGAGIGAAGRFIGPPISQPILDSIEFAKARGLKLDWATMADSQWFRRAQNFLGKATIGGGMVEAGAERMRQSGLQRVAGELGDAISPSGALSGVDAARGVQASARATANADLTAAAGRVFASPITREQAGGAVESGLMARVKDNAKTARENYKIVDQAEADSTAQIARDLAERNNVFKWNGNDRQLRRKAWEDAKQAGFSGTRQEFDYLLTQRMNDAEDLVNQVNGEGDFGRRVLEFIAESGGIGRGKEPVYTGEVQALWDSATPTRVMHKAVTASGKAAQFPRGSIGGVDGVVNKDGLTLAEMAERVRNNPEFGTTFEGLSDTELVQVIEEMARTAGRIKATPGEALAHVGVRPGAAWWSDAANAGTEGAEKSFAGRITGEMTPDDVPVGLPTDLRPFKERFGPLVEKELQAIRAAQGLSDPGLVALKQMIDSADVVPWSVAEENLKAFKKIARTGGGPGVISPSQRLAKMAVDELETAIQAGLKNTPDAADALMKARAATLAKYKVSGLAKKLGAGDEYTSQVRVYTKLVAPGDVNLPLLRKTADQLGPDEMRKIGRAYVDEAAGTLDPVMVNDPRRAKRAVADLDKLGAETRRILFGSDQEFRIIRDTLDRRAAFLDAATGADGALTPERLFETLLSPKGGMDVLNAMPLTERAKVGRAVLDEMVSKASKMAGTRGESSVWSQWLQIPEAKKAMLIADPQVRKNVDDFALYAFRSAQDFNPSGSGYMMGFNNRFLDAAGMIGGSTALTFATGWKIAVTEGLAGGINLMLHSPKAMNLFRTLTKNPPKSGARTGALVNQLATLMGGVAVSPDAATRGTAPTPQEQP